MGSLLELACHIEYEAEEKPANNIIPSTDDADEDDEEVVFGAGADVKM